MQNFIYRDITPEDLCRDEPQVLVLVTHLVGSAPREVGAALLVGKEGLIGTIGGGVLEQEAVIKSRNLLGRPAHEKATFLETCLLGPEREQCCGGAVTLWYHRLHPQDRDTLIQQAVTTPSSFPENGSNWGVLFANGRPEQPLFVRSPSPSQPQHRTTKRRANELPQPHRYPHDSPIVFIKVLPRLMIFGAGHVGKALIHKCAGLFRPLLADSRADYLATYQANIETHLLIVPDLSSESISPQVEGLVRADDRVLIMTHSHELDYQILRTAIERQDVIWLGLIGSKTKGARFRSRLRRDGVDDRALARLISPVGRLEITGKEPERVALSILASLCWEEK